MKKLIWLLSLLLPLAAQAEILQYSPNSGGGGGGGVTITSPNGTLTIGGTSSNPTIDIAALLSGRILVGNSSNIATGVALSGDCTMSNAGAITCTKTGGVAFGSLATLNAAPAGTLTGTTLAANVVTSSLTSVGTIGTGVWQGTAIANSFLANPSTTVNTQTCTLGSSCTVAAAAGTLTGTTLASNVVTSSLTSAAGGSFGTAAFVNTGTSGATVPLLNAINTYGALQTYGNNISFGGKQLNVTSLTTNDVLQYNGTNWINVAPSSFVGVTSVSGTTNRITSTGGATPVIDISAAYVGQSSITTLGTIGTGTWQGTPVTNTFLANPATTVNGQTCTLGSTCTVAAAAGTLTGTTLAANVVTSSLTSIGTIGTGTWQGTPIANAYIANPSTTVNGQTCTLGSTCTAAADAGTLTGTTLAANVVTSSLTTVGTIGTGTWQATPITNTYIANPSTTVNGQTCTLGSSCTAAAAAGTLTGTTLASGVVNSSLTSAAGGSFGTAAYVNTGTSGGTVPLLNAANTFSAAQAISASTTTSFSVGQNGATNPAFNIDASTASSVTGLTLSSRGTGAGVVLNAISSGSNETIQINPKGNGSVVVGNSGTGAFVVGSAGGGSITMQIMTFGSISGTNVNAPVNSISAGIGAGTGKLGTLTLRASTAKQASGNSFHALTDILTIGSNQTAHPAVGGALLAAPATTWTDANTANSGTAASLALYAFGQPTVAATNTSVTTTAASTVYIANSPTAGTNMTLTNAYALNVAAGISRLAGAIQAPGLASSSAADTGTLCWNTTVGDITVNTVGTCLASTRKIKEGIIDLDVGLAELMKLRPVSYQLKKEYNHGNEGRQMGLIAEEVNDIDKRLVGFDKEGDPQSVRYQQLTALLVKAIQEQQKQIDYLLKHQADKEKENGTSTIHH